MTVLPTRNADGTIDMHDLLAISKDAPATAGASIVARGKAVSEQPAITTVVSVQPMAAEVTDTPSEKTEQGASNTGMVVGGVIGVAVIAAVAVLLGKKKKDQKEN